MKSIALTSRRTPIMSVLFWAAILMTRAGIHPAFADETPLHIPRVEKHLIKSEFIDQVFEIHVQVPISLKDGSERFPVLYMTDINHRLDTTLVHMMHLNGDVARFITVGIGYPVDHVLGSNNLRRRDLTPTEVEKEEFPNDLLIEGILPIETAKKTGAAPEFLQFIRKQLMPFINDRYNTVPEETTFYGHSLGGLFGLYVMFNQPDTFTNYMIGSPSIWWDNHIGIRMAESFIKSGRSIPGRVYLAVGGKEELGRGGRRARMVTNVYSLESLLTDANMPGLQLRTEVFPDERHADVIPMILSRGLRYVFGSEVPVFLKLAAAAETAQ